VRRCFNGHVSRRLIMENITLYQFITFSVGTGGITALSQLPKVKDVCDKNFFEKFKNIYEFRSQYGPNTLKRETKTVFNRLFSLQILVYFLLEIFLIWLIYIINYYGNEHFIFKIIFDDSEKISFAKSFLVFTIIIGILNLFVFVIQTFVPWIRLIIIYFKAKHKILTNSYDSVR
jgi:hypothetical protein